MRIASLSPAATEILFALCLEKDIVCVDQFSNFPEEARGIPHVRDHQKVKVEELKKFRPEIVLTGTVVQAKLAEELQGNSHDFSVLHQDPRTIGQVYDSIRQLGAVFEKESEANALVLQMQQDLNALKKKAALLPRRLKIYIEEWHMPPMASGNWMPELVRIAGGEPFPIPTGELSREVSLEEMQRFNPDMIVISWCGAGSLADKELLLKRQGWDALQAVQEGRVRVIDDSLLNRPGPRLLQGAQRLYGWMFEQLH